MTSLPVISEDIPSSQDLRTVTIRRNDIQYRLPENGVVLPIQIQLPVTTSAKAAIIDFVNSLGFNAPQSYTRNHLLMRTRALLRSYGYQDRANSLYTIDRPIRLIYPPEDRPAPTASVRLPEFVPLPTFSTRQTIVEFVRENNLGEFIRTGQQRLKGDLVRDVTDFLTAHGYSNDAAGSYVRLGGATIEGGQTYTALIDEGAYRDFLENVPEGSVTITQEDLMKLNLPLKQLLARTPARHWTGVQSVAEDTGRVLEIDPRVMKLVFLINRLPHLNNKVLTSLIGTAPRMRMDQRVDWIKSLLRTKINLVPRTWPRRETFTGDATATMSFEEAIRNGYRFGPDQYQDELDELMNAMVVNTPYKLFLRELVQVYPDLFNVVRSFLPGSLADQLIVTYYQEPPTIVQRLYTFGVNYPLTIPEDAAKTKRREVINSLPRPWLNVLYGIYRSRNLEEILNRDEHPLEAYLPVLWSATPDQLPQVMLGAGMVVPEHLLTTEIRHYVMNWLPQYRDIITRPKDTPSINEAIPTQPENAAALIDQLSLYTDQEITTFFGYTGGFDTRNALIDNVYRLLTEQGFFLLREIDTNRATNTETVMLTEVADLMRPYIVFGTPLAYRVLELDELLQAFHPDSAGLVTFNGIGRDQVYTLGHITKLQTILPTMKEMNAQLTASVDRALQYVKTGIVAGMDRNSAINRFINDVRHYSGREDIKSLFYLMLYAGMYMRKWRGPGNRYPFRTASTRNELDPQPKVILTLEVFWTTFNSLQSSFQEAIRELPEIDFRNNDITILTAPVLRIIDDASHGKYCIRSASRRLVITAYYYLSVTFNELVPDFNPDDLDAIS